MGVVFSEEYSQTVQTSRNKTKKDHTHHTHIHTHTHTKVLCQLYYLLSILYTVSSLCIKGDNRPALCYTHIQCNRSVTDPYKSTTHTCDVCIGFTSCGPRETIYPQCVPHIQCTVTVTEPYQSNTINPFTAMAGCRDLT